MNVRPKVLGIIPARTGSERIKNKNFRDFAGKPLLIHSIEQAVGSQLINQVVVSSNHKQPKEVLGDRFYNLFLQRPEKISHSKAKGYTYVKHALEYLKTTAQIEFSHFVVLPPTGPLRTSTDIDNCIQKLLDTKCDTVVSIVKVNQMFHGIKQKILKGEIIQPFIVEEKGRTSYDELPDVYVRNCAIYASKVEVLKEQSLIGKECRGYLMPPERSVDINDPIDFEFAEYLYRKFKT